MDKEPHIFMGGRGNGKTMMQNTILLSEGNPGCMAFLSDLINIGEYGLFATLADIGLKGSRAYQLWNDCCDRDTKKAAAVLKAYKDKKISAEEIHEHTDLPRGTAFDLEEILAREPREGREIRKEHDIDEEFLEILDIVEPKESEDPWKFTEEAIKRIHNLADACRQTPIYKANSRKAAEYMQGKYAQDLWMDMIVKVAVAPTKMHARCAVRLMMPIISDAIKEGRHERG